MPEPDQESPPLPPLPIGAVYALASAATREWWRTCGCTGFSGQDFADHRRIIEVPRAERKLRELLALPKADMEALGRALLSGRAAAA